VLAPINFVHCGGCSGCWMLGARDSEETHIYMYTHILEGKHPSMATVTSLTRPTTDWTSSALLAFARH
jgi:hypothetical protein